MTEALGILGLGSQSTLFYISELNRLYHNKHGGYSTCPFKLLNTNFDKINNLLPQVSEQLDTIVSQYIDKLIQLQVGKILIPNITLHQTIERLDIKTPIINPIDHTILKIRNMSCRKVVLFGSLYTMQSGNVKEKFIENGIEVLVPSENDQILIDALRKQVYYQKETTEQLRAFNLLIETYCQNHSIVLACTELSLASGIQFENVFDMSRIQINAAIDSIW